MEATTLSLSRTFFWDTLPKFGDLLVLACIHFIFTTGGDRIPRMFGPAVHGTKANDPLQFYDIEMGLDFKLVKSTYLCYEATIAVIRDCNLPHLLDYKKILTLVYIGVLLLDELLV